MNLVIAFFHDDGKNFKIETKFVSKLIVVIVVHEGIISPRLRLGMIIFHALQ